ncbi:hypothetical protein KP509_22G027800 [Ceratopteris richardii]|nr:hypothetical protein KP509_22G027800 [Ceratopteris richardii]
MLLTQHSISDGNHSRPSKESYNEFDEGDVNDAVDAPDKVMLIRYEKCLKNHAASIGGQIVDGCGEFIPSGNEGSEAFKCAACSCHRSFHRKQVKGGDKVQICVLCRNETERPMFSAHETIRPSWTDDGMMFPASLCGSNGHGALTLHKKKRHRTTFSLEQKERMFYFAEGLGWKILKQDEESVQNFCDDVGVPRRNFKVWMHNHKHVMKSK